MKKLFIAIGWLAIISTTMEVISYSHTGETSNRWGSYSGTNARDVMIGNIIMALIFGGYSIRETYRYFKNRKMNIPDDNKMNDNK